jgi:hypothetical protein
VPGARPRNEGPARTASVRDRHQRRLLGAVMPTGGGPAWAEC